MDQSDTFPSGGHRVKYYLQDRDLVFIWVLDTTNGPRINYEIRFTLGNEGYLPTSMIPWYDGYITLGTQYNGSQGIIIHGHIKGYRHTLSPTDNYEIIESVDTTDSHHSNICYVVAENGSIISYQEVTKGNGDIWRYFQISDSISEVYAKWGQQPPSWYYIEEMMEGQMPPRYTPEPSQLLNQQPLPMNQLITLYQAVPLPSPMII